ncbi:hypothetical protein AKJ51_01005 [candidate division MSBL1 archaeon SCGC-AAA382A20]|uniref:Uncharacterized protein n=1 Tax=candidate division MSBL1 archaeon SCGC-AAA382A20 TaxID=1698280 RepID=A0A133VM68_9EURY|nr:hypothetical protein AKJ51_01005 [candidate division MSBL1 archaeon SCGC-AAA382A20]
MKKIIKKFNEIRWEDAKSPKWWVNLVEGQIRLYFYIARETVRDRCMRQAAALTFTTLLTLVPLFAIAFSLFRGFVAFEGLQKQAERTILRTMLTLPATTTDGAGGGWKVESDSLSSEEKQLSAQKLIEKADKLPRESRAGTAARLYMLALEKGGDVKGIREGLSTLYFGPVKQVRDIFKVENDEVLASFFKAIGKKEKGTKKNKEKAYRHFSRSLGMADQLAFKKALEELQKAKKAGYPLDGIKFESAKIYYSMGETEKKNGNVKEAIEQYEKAALFSTDAVILNSNNIDNAILNSKKLNRTIDNHNDALKALGEAHLAIGHSYYNRYKKAEDSESVELNSAIENYQKACYYLENSRTPHLKLAESLWEMGDKKEARKNYQLAVEKGKLSAAKNFSVAAADYIRKLSSKVSSAGLGIIGILVLVLTATSLLNTIEKTLNEIWQVSESRKFWIKFTEFCTLIWLGPALIAASIFIRQKLAYQMGALFIGIPVLDSLFHICATIGRFVLPFITVWLLLLALYKFLPHTRVKIGPACWGAFVGTILIQIARPGFGFYISNAIRYEKIYGSLAAFPVFLLWLWLLWVLVLFGAEVAFTVQNLGLLRFQDRQSRLSKIFIDRYLAARIMMYVGREFWQYGHPMTIDRLAETMQIPVEEAADAAKRLIRLDLLTPVGEEHEAVHPAKDLSNLTVMEVLSITDKFRDDSRSQKLEDSPYEGKLEEVFDNAINAQKSALEGLTFADLMEQCDEASDDSSPAKNNEAELESPKKNPQIQNS